MEIYLWLFLAWALQWLELIPIWIDNLFQYFIIFILFVIFYPIYKIYKTIKEHGLQKKKVEAKEELKESEIFLSIYIIAEIIAIPCLIITFYLYFNSVPDKVGGFVPEGCSGSIWSKVGDWFYQGITFSNYNSCTKKTIISEYFAILFWVYVIAEIIGSYFFFFKYKKAKAMNR
tara:strand:+ start:11 stop:532 length:522 start_codon:yes stop_codon:yes gene_type:complete